MGNLILDSYLTKKKKPHSLSIVKISKSNITAFKIKPSTYIILALIIINFKYEKDNFKIYNI